MASFMAKTANSGEGEGRKEDTENLCRNKMNIEQEKNLKSLNPKKAQNQILRERKTERNIFQESQPIFSSALQQSLDRKETIKKTFGISESIKKGQVKYLHKKQNKSLIKSDSLWHQNEVDFTSRVLLIDWLIEVEVELKLRPQTTFLAVLYTDKFLFNNPIKKSKLQLLGIGSLMVAIKHNEVEQPTIDIFIKLSANSITKKELIEIEEQILKENNFNLQYITVYDFYGNIYLDLSESEREALLYLLYISLVNSNHCTVAPSSVIFAALYIVSRLIPFNFQQVLEKNGIETSECEIERKKTLKEVCYALEIGNCNYFEGYKRRFGTESIQLFKRLS